MTVHQSAEHGYTLQIQSYEEGRPNYPRKEVINWLLNDLDLSSSSRVIDLGAGTGKFISYLQAITTNIVAIEPVLAMRQQLQQNYSNIEIIDGTAAQMPIADESIDVIICAQSFHWFAGEQALQEMNRVLKPNGKLGLIWNVRDEKITWVSDLSAIINSYEEDTPRFHTMDWRKFFPNKFFTDLKLIQAANNIFGSVEDIIIKRTLSVSFIAKLPTDEQDKVIAKLRGLINKTPALAHQKKAIFPYTTMMFSCFKR